MILDDMQIPRYLTAASTNYKTFYNWRVEQLLGYMCELFDWSGLPESIPEHEIDMYLYLYGKCGVHKIPGSDTLITTPVQESDPTDYFDEFKKYTWATPLHSGQQYNGVNGIVIKNTKLHTSSYPLIHCTAAKLAHADVSYICTAVNSRSNRTYAVTSSKFAHDADEYQRRLYNGIPGSVVDKGFSTIDIRDNKSSAGLGLRDLIETQNIILADFWENIGVLKVGEKRERMVTAETDINTTLLHLNIKNMYDERVKAAAAINTMFDTSIAVKCNVDISRGENDEMLEGSI